MAERDRQLERDVDADAEGGVDSDVDLSDDFDVDIASEALADAETAEASGGLRASVGKRIGLSKRGLAVSTVVAFVGIFLLGAVAPFGLVGNLAGLFLATFLYGAVAGDSQYLSVGLTGGAVSGLAGVLGNLTLTLLGPGIPIAAVAALGGAVAGVLGHYFGRDLRDGLTREL